jgi:hypothetical protein
MYEGNMQLFTHNQGPPKYFRGHVTQSFDKYFQSNFFFKLGHNLRK